MIIGALTGFVMGGGPTGAVIGAVGSLLPDIDHPNSTISNKLFPLGVRSRWGRAMIGLALAVASLHYSQMYLFWAGVFVLVLAFIPHRGVLHSPIFMILLSFILYSYWGQMEAIKFLLAGYLSHLVADSLTSGVPWLWPYKSEKIGFNLIRTGSAGEYIFTALISFMLLFYWM